MLSYAGVLNEVIDRGPPDARAWELVEEMDVSLRGSRSLWSDCCGVVAEM